MTHDARGILSAIVDDVGSRLPCEVEKYEATSLWYDDEIDVYAATFDVWVRDDEDQLSDGSFVVHCRLSWNSEVSVVKIDEVEGKLSEERGGAIHVLRDCYVRVL